MKNFLRKYRLSLDPLTISNIVFGLFLIINPEFSTKFIFIILGVISLIWGIVSLYRHFRVKKFGYKSKFDMIQAIAGIVLCFIFIFCYKMLAAILPIIIGIIIILQSISKIKMALYQKRSGADKWLLAMSLNIIGLLLGIFLFFNPFKALLNVVRLIGIILFINGITRLFTDFFFEKEMDKINHEGSDIIDVTFDENNNE